MKDFVFVSDFDGTITDIDFDEILLLNILKDRKKEFDEIWENGNLNIIDYLKFVYGSINCSEEKLLEEILKIKIDEYLKDFIKFVRNNNGEFIVVSSGTSYYIDIILKKYKLNKIKVISNKGIFINNRLELIIDKNSYIYSKEFGIDKKKIVEDLKNEYKEVYYAGDGKSDLNAALSSDLIFSKGTLKTELNRMQVKNIEFENYKKIKEFLENDLKCFS